MPQPDVLKKHNSFEAKTDQGFFLGWHILPGGLWSGDYYVAELLGTNGFYDDVNKRPHEVRIHRVKEVSMPKTECYPIAQWRHERRHLILERAGAPPVIVGHEKDETHVVDLGGPSGTPEAFVVEVPPPPHDFPPVSTEPRGLGEDIGGRKVRPYKCTKRPPSRASCVETAT